MWTSLWLQEPEKEHCAILTILFSLLFFKLYVKPFGTILSGFYLARTQDHVNTEESSTF